MYSISEETLARYRKKKELANKPLSEFYVKHKDLIKKVLYADRTYQYSDCASTYRNASKYHEELVLLIQETQSVTESQEEKDFLQKLISYYTSDKFTDEFFEIYHPDFHHSGKTPLYGLEVFIDRITCIVSSPIDENTRLTNVLNHMERTRVELNKLFDKLEAFMNQNKTTLSGQYLCLDEQLKCKAFFTSEFYKTHVRRDCYLLSDKLIREVDVFLSEYAAYLMWMSLFAKDNWNMNRDLPRVHAIERCTSSAMNCFEVVLSVGDKYFKVVVHNHHSLPIAKKNIFV